MYNGIKYNQAQYNQDGTHSGRRIRTTYLTSNLPRQPMDKVFPEENISSVTPIDFIDNPNDLRDIMKEFE